jgi:hypothetical protein
MQEVRALHLIVLVLPSAPPPNGFIDSRGLNNMKVGIASNDIMLIRR